MLKILFAGTPDVAVPSLRALAADSEHFEVVAVLTRPDAPTGRGRKLTPSPVKTAALELGLPVLESDPAEPTFLDELKVTGAQAAAVIAYGRILKQSVLDALPCGWYNLHFSLLPHWRGAAPVQRAIWSGDDMTGTSVFRITRAMDAGPLLVQSETPIGEHETAGDLLTRLGRRLPGGGEDPRQRRAYRFQCAGGSGRPSDSRVHAESRGMDRTGCRRARARRWAVHAARAAGAPGRYDQSERTRVVGVWGARSWQEECLDRHRLHTSGIAGGQGAGQEGDARRRLGARSPTLRSRALPVTRCALRTGGK